MRYNNIPRSLKKNWKRGYFGGEEEEEHRDKIVIRKRHWTRLLYFLYTQVYKISVGETERETKYCVCMLGTRSHVLWLRSEIASEAEETRMMMVREIKTKKNRGK